MARIAAAAKPVVQGRRQEMVVGQRQQALHITVEALDGNGQFHTFTCSLANLPVIDDSAWQAMAADALVQRRCLMRVHLLLLLRRRRRHCRRLQRRRRRPAPL